MKTLLHRIKRPIKNRKGFTYAELVVSIALFAVIGTMGYTMFSISSNYMSKAKREEAKQSETYSAYLADNFKVDDDNYRIYKASVLSTEYVVTKTGTATATYYANIVYNTSYGDVSYSFPITLAKNFTTSLGYSVTSYTVSSDVGTPRVLLIYDSPDYDEGSYAVSDYIKLK